MAHIIVGVLEPGDRGTDRTLMEMRGMAQRAEPYIPDALRRFDPWTLREWLAEHMRFEADPPGTELVRHPLLMLDSINRGGYAVGDCDDAATLGATLALASGLLARYRVVGFSRDGPFAHVWTDAFDPRTGLGRDLDIFRPRELPSGLAIYREAVVEMNV